MAGNEPVDLPVAVDIVGYWFSTSDGDLLLALWRDGVAADVDLGATATVLATGVPSVRTTAVDVVYGLETELVTEESPAGVVIRDLVVRDSPLVVRFAGAASLIGAAPQG